RGRDRVLEAAAHGAAALQASGKLRCAELREHARQVRRADGVGHLLERLAGVVDRATRPPDRGLAERDHDALDRRDAVASHYRLAADACPAQRERQLLEEPLAAA